MMNLTKYLLESQKILDRAEKIKQIYKDSGVTTREKNNPNHWDDVISLRYCESMILRIRNNIAFVQDNYPEGMEAEDRTLDGELKYLRFILKGLENDLRYCLRCKYFALLQEIPIMSERILQPRKVHKQLLNEALNELSYVPGGVWPSISPGHKFLQAVEEKSQFFSPKNEFAVVPRYRLSPTRRSKSRSKSRSSL